ncbi:MAG: holo-[acyl-carrier-protein] synthase [Planctomycetota bacterium]|nr:MAG: holo-[acyl-carrier-protein] synthase [Planctomycetota bacterium]
MAHGIDLIECERIAHILRDHPERFLDRILTPAERAYCQRNKNPVPHIAGRFAAKEAILKVLGTGWRGQISWTDIEILNDEAGQPHATLKGPTADIARQKGFARVIVSITHTENYAAASAIGLGL